MFTMGLAIGEAAPVWALVGLRNRTDLIIYRSRLLKRLIPFMIIVLFFFLLQTRTLVDLQYRDPQDAQLRHACYTHAYPAACDSLDKFTGEGQYIERSPAARP